MRRSRPRRSSPPATRGMSAPTFPASPRKVTPYTGGFPTYIEKCDAVVANGYEGFSLTAT